MNKRCTWEGPEAKTCGNRPLKGSDRCRWHPRSEQEATTGADPRAFVLNFGMRLSGVDSGLSPLDLTDLGTQGPTPDTLSVTWENCEFDVSTADGALKATQARGEFSRQFRLLFHAIGRSAIGLLTSRGEALVFDLQQPDSTEAEQAVDQLRTRNHLLGITLPESFSDHPAERALKEEQAVSRLLQADNKANGPRPHPVRLDKAPEAPNSRLFQLLNQGLVHKDAWETNSDEAHKAYTNPHGAVIWQPFDPSDRYGSDWWNTCKAEVIKALETRFRALKNDLAADIIDLLFYHWALNGRPTPVGITLAQVCAYRGVKATPAALQDHWRAMQDVRRIELRSAHVQEARLFNMDVARIPSQSNLWNAEAPPRADVVYFYSPGHFVAAALKESELLAIYSRELLTLDPYRDRTAKRLGRYLRSDWRSNPEGYLPDECTAFRYRTWDEHLKSAGVELSDRDRKHVGDFIETLYTHLAKLSDHDMLAKPPSGVALGEWVENTLTHPTQRGPLPAGKTKLHTFMSRRVHLPPAEHIVVRLRDLVQKRAGLLAARAAAKTKALVAPPKQSS